MEHRQGGTLPNALHGMGDIAYFEPVVGQSKWLSGTDEKTCRCPSISDMRRWSVPLALLDTAQQMLEGGWCD